MFDALIASAPRKRTHLTSRGVLASVALHALFLAGGVTLSAHSARERVRPDELVTFIDIQEAPLLPPVMEPRREGTEDGDPAAPTRREAPKEEGREPPTATGFQELVPPERVAASLPEIDPALRAVDPRDFSGLGASAGIVMGLTGGQRSSVVLAAHHAGQGVLVDVDEVQVKPRLQNESRIQSLLRRLYPPVLREAGVTGRVLMRFVVDARGRVEPNSVELISASHHDFADASALVVEQFQFRPARMRGRTVRVLVSLPIEWTLHGA